MTAQIKELVREATTFQALQDLILDEAKILAEHGIKAAIKDGPVKWELNALAMKRNALIRRLVKLQVGVLTTKPVEQIDAEEKQAIHAWQDEVKTLPDVELTKAEATQMYVERMTVGD